MSHIEQLQIDRLLAENEMLKQKIIRIEDDIKMLHAAINRLTFKPGKMKMGGNVGIKN